MITSETPYKLAEIIRDTWPQLYILQNSRYNDQKNETYDDWKSRTRRECDG
jgi:hypothetical protein